MAFVVVLLDNDHREYFADSTVTIAQRFSEESRCPPSVKGMEGGASSTERPMTAGNTT